MLVHQLEGGIDHRFGFIDTRHRRVRARQQNERVAVAMPRAVERAFRAVAPFDFPVVAFIHRVPVRVAQERERVTGVVLMLLAAEMTKRHRVVEDEARAADEVSRGAVVDRAVVLEKMKKTARVVAGGSCVERQCVANVIEEKIAAAKVRFCRTRHLQSG
jgi:hypothetical protein